MLPMRPPKRAPGSCEPRWLGARSARSTSSTSAMLRMGAVMVLAGQMGGMAPARRALVQEGAGRLAFRQHPRRAMRRRCPHRCRPGSRRPCRPCRRARLLASCWARGPPLASQCSWRSTAASSSRRRHTLVQQADTHCFAGVEDLARNRRRACRAPWPPPRRGRYHRRHQAQLHLRDRTSRCPPMAISQQATRTDAPPP